MSSFESIHTETIEWFDAQFVKPDADIRVIVQTTGGCVFEAHYEGDGLWICSEQWEWRNVAFWADFPEGVKQ